MKKTIIVVLLAVACVTASAQDVMLKEKDGTYVVNTTTLAQDVEGYSGLRLWRFISRRTKSSRWCP